VQKYGELLQDFRGALKDLCDRATEYAEKQYALYGHSKIQVSVEFNSPTFATIYAKDTSKRAAIAFFEFGTGEVGRGTYPDNTKLPQSGVPITGDWEYYYPSGSKETKDGVKGWRWGAAFVKGNKAEAEMWRTSQYIQRYARQIISDYFKKSKGGG
jgi:hypothetical protein